MSCVLFAYSDLFGCKTGVWAILCLYFSLSFEITKTRKWVETGIAYKISFFWSN